MCYINNEDSIRKLMVNSNPKVNSMLTSLLINARSLKNKLADLHYVLYGENNSYDIISFCETWLNNTVSDNMLDPRNRFNVFRCDRVSKGGGGVCVFINRNLHCERVFVENFPPLFEYVCLDFHGASTLRIIVIYRPGGSRVSVGLVMDLLCDFLKTSCSDDKTSVILGDLNCNKINWKSGKVDCDTLQQKFLKPYLDLVWD